MLALISRARLRWNFANRYLRPMACVSACVLITSALWTIACVRSTFRWERRFPARQDAGGYFWLMGRLDDVMNVSGHRLGTMEVESALEVQTEVEHLDLVS